MKAAEIERKARKILGVPDDAGKEQIRLAYRRLAKQFHPDINGGDKTMTYRFKLVSEAYEILIGVKNTGKHSLIKAEVSTPDNEPFKDDRSYWEWWKERFGDLI